MPSEQKNTRFYFDAIQIFYTVHYLIDNMFNQKRVIHSSYTMDLIGPRKYKYT